MSNNSSPIIHEAYRFSIAPMLDCTDSHFRLLMRQISRRALLYTEMVVVQALLKTNNRAKLLKFDPIEHPIALQIGGDNPHFLSEAVKIAADWGYDEVNLNVGCPSPKVKAGNFGACLMANPEQVARCIEAMTNASNLPITIKHRLGIDNFDNEIFLKKFVDHSAAAGAQRFVIHARKAWLNGLNPKENRTIPPLEYYKVEKLKIDRPNLIIELNGGLKEPNDCIKALKICDGAMVGRAAYSHPLLWQTIDSIIFNEQKKETTASKVILNLIPYAEKYLAEGGKLWNFCRHFLQLVEDVPGAKKWRNNFSQSMQAKTASIALIEQAAEQLKENGL